MKTKSGHGKYVSRGRGEKDNWVLDELFEVGMNDGICNTAFSSTNVDSELYIPKNSSIFLLFIRRSQPNEVNRSHRIPAILLHNLRLLSGLFLPNRVVVLVSILLHVLLVYIILRSL